MFLCGLYDDFMAAIAGSPSNRSKPFCFANTLSLQNEEKHVFVEINRLKILLFNLRLGELRAQSEGVRLKSSFAFASAPWFINSSAYSIVRSRFQFEHLITRAEATSSALQNKEHKNEIEITQSIVFSPIFECRMNECNPM